MPTLVSGYENDIFISYRHKDNKGDHWVTEFVKALKTELEATFKEDISIYFDENPHDGLLETHDVDNSLKDKLKCLIFIPIVSQTYCDPRSFAWTNEFLVFKKSASTDALGLKVKLSNGNVGSRILPVRIHDLTTSDQKLVEDEIGPIRGIEFIFRAAGVNRPLTPTDSPEKNLSRTFYKDQINKIANSVREIVGSLLEGQIGTDGQGTNTESRVGNYQEKVKTLIETLKLRKHVLNPRLSFRSMALIALLISLLAAGGWLKLILEDKGEILPVYSIIPLNEPIPGTNQEEPNFSISADGQSIVYAQPNGLFVQTLSDFKALRLKGTDNSFSPAFSPDGRFVAFTQNGWIKKYDLHSGIITDLATSTTRSVFWGQDNRIYFDAGLSVGIWSVPDNGGTPIRITNGADSVGEVIYQWPQLHTDKKTLIYTAISASKGMASSKIVAQRLGSSEQVTLVEKAISGRILSTGDLLYATASGNVYAIPFNSQELKVSGSPKSVLSDVQTASWGGAAFLSVSETGNLVYIPRNQRAQNSLVIKDENGETDSQSSHLDSLISKRAGQGWFIFAISPNGKQAIVTGVTYDQMDVWRMDLTSGDTERLTLDIAQEENPVWSPKGKYFAYTAANKGTSRSPYIKSLEGGSSPILIRKWPRHMHIQSWSPDSLYLAAYDFSASSRDVWAIPIDGKDPIAIATSKADEMWPVFSPDGRWLAYQSNENGLNEVYVVSFPSLDLRKQISVGGGSLPRWNKKGDAIFFLQGNTIVRQDAVLGKELILGKKRVLFEVSPDLNYLDISPDGKKFYLIGPNKKKDHEQLHLITNWFKDIERKAGQ